MMDVIDVFVVCVVNDFECVWGVVMKCIKVVKDVFIDGGVCVMDMFVYVVVVVLLLIVDVLDDV